MAKGISRGAFNPAYCAKHRQGWSRMQREIDRPPDNKKARVKLAGDDRAAEKKTLLWLCDGVTLETSRPKRYRRKP